MTDITVPVSALLKGHSLIWQVHFFYYYFYVFHKERGKKCLEYKKERIQNVLKPSSTIIHKAWKWRLENPFSSRWWTDFYKRPQRRPLTPEWGSIFSSDVLVFIFVCVHLLIFFFFPNKGWPWNLYRSKRAQRNNCSWNLDEIRLEGRHVHQH